MLGVVLWCDAAARLALIWCEDQGDLAWYEPGGAEAAPIGTGDLVHVGLGAGQGMRRAHALRVLAQRVGCDLPRHLVQAAR
jgi:hypothetical protein